MVDARTSGPILHMRIKRHSKSYIVKLNDDSVWHIWPGDLAGTLGWLPTTELELVQIDHEICSHALVDSSTGSNVKVSAIETQWPIERVRQLLSRFDED